MAIRLVSSHGLPGLLLLVVSGLVVGGCGTASAWTDLHTAHLPEGRQYVVHGTRDANGQCIYNLSWMPTGSIEQDVARNDSTCDLVAEVAPAVPTRAAAHPSRVQVRSHP